MTARRSLVNPALLAGVLGLAAVSICVGDFPIPLDDVLRSLVGQGSEDGDFIVRVLRAPRALTGILVGCAFGLSGAIFQSLARNPLASPDVLGVESGAAAGAVLVILLVGGGSSVPVAGGALAGALLAALAVYLLAYRRGVAGYRLILVGIGVAAVLSSLVSYLLVKAEVYEAQRAAQWLTGSLNGRGWEHVRPVAAALVVLAPVALLLRRELRTLQLGDDTATGLGIGVERTRAFLLLVAVLLAGVATASAGPVAFVAFVAPQIGRRLAGQSTIALVPAMLTGALVVVGADLAGRRLLAPTELPVGILTAVVGAPYLLWLLARANRAGRGA